MKKIVIPAEACPPHIRRAGSPALWRPGIPFVIPFRRDLWRFTHPPQVQCRKRRWTPAFAGVTVIWCLSHTPIALGITKDWKGTVDSYFNTDGNWDTVGAPLDDARFSAVGPTAIALSFNTGLNSLTFSPGASAYTLTVGDFQSFILSGVGIINNSGTTQTLDNNGDGGRIQFNTNATADNATIMNTHSFAQLEFHGNSTAGNATITNNAGAILRLYDFATLGNATVINNGVIDSFTFFLAPSWTVGSISGSGNIALGSHNLTVGSNDLSTTITGVIGSTDGSLTKVGNGTLTLAGVNTYTGATTVNGGTLNLTGSLSSEVTVGPAGNLSGTGALRNLANNGTVTPGVNGAGTLTALTYTGTGTLTANFNGASHGTLNIDGNANLTGGTLAATGSNISVGRYSFLSAGSLTGVFAASNNPTTLLNVIPEYTATNVSVLINFATPFASFAQNTNQRSVAANLNGQKNTSTLEFTNAINTIAQLPASQIPGALSQISGDSLASFQEVGLQNAAMFTKGMRQRAVSVSSDSYGLWAQGVGGVDTMDGDAALGSPASRAATGGFQTGYDTLLAEDFLLGFSGGYAETSLDVNDRASSGNTKSLQSGLYARYDRGDWFANAATAYIGGANSMTRDIRYGGLNEQAAAHFRSRQFTTLVEGGYAFRRRNNVSIEPSLSLRHDHLTQPGFTETGAPGLNLTVADRSLDSVVSSLGVDVRRLFLADSAHPLGTSVHLGWEHELGQTHDALSAHFAETSGGSDFTVEGTPRSRDAAAIGLEGHVALRENLELFASYTATLASVQTIQKLFGGARLKW